MRVIYFGCLFFIIIIVFIPGLYSHHSKEESRRSNSDLLSLTSDDKKESHRQKREDGELNSLLQFQSSGSGKISKAADSAISDEYKLNSNKKQKPRLSKRKRNKRKRRNKSKNLSTIITTTSPLNTNTNTNLISPATKNDSITSPEPVLIIKNGNKKTKKRSGNKKNKHKTKRNNNNNDSKLKKGRREKRKEDVGVDGKKRLKTGKVRTRKRNKNKIRNKNKNLPISRAKGDESNEKIMEKVLIDLNNEDDVKSLNANEYNNKNSTTENLITTSKPSSSDSISRLYFERVESTTSTANSGGRSKPKFTINYDRQFSNLASSQNENFIPKKQILVVQNVTIQDLLNELSAIEEDLLKETTKTKATITTNKGNSSSTSSLLHQSTIHNIIENDEDIKCKKCQHFCNKIADKNHTSITITCSCRDGFKLASNKRQCIDINECANNNGGCSNTCRNTPGSYHCLCPRGLRLGDDRKTCYDINECLLRNGHGPCQDTCINTFASYKCSCTKLPGFKLTPDKHTCENVNTQCSKEETQCSHGCISTLSGRTFCTCPSGMFLGKDWKTCQDIDECDDEEIIKICHIGCVNTPGSYHCVTPENELQNDAESKSEKDVVCPPIFPPKEGYLNCTRNNLLGEPIKTRHGRIRITNRPGTVCSLICPEKHTLKGNFSLRCNEFGKWTGNKTGVCKI